MVSKEKAAQSATLAALQKFLREELVKLLLPAAEAAKEVMNITTPEKSPEVLMSSIFEFFAPTEDEDTDVFDAFGKLNEAQQQAQVVHACFTHVHDRARSGCGRRTRGSGGSL